jgi:hypothetical protein
MKIRINKVNKGNIQLKELGISWKSKILLKRATAYISINKLIVNGCDLKKGKELYSYLAEDETGRRIMITYLDGKTRKITEKP